jgi:D-xylonolactonase
MLELIANYHCATGEGPLWHPGHERLYWVDIPDGELYSYDPAIDEHELRHEGERVGGFTIQESGDLLLFGESGSVRIWNDGLGETVIPEIPEDADSRFNDVIAGPEGRVYCGTMAGNLYCLDTDGRLRTLMEEVATPNGMGFTPDREHLYFTETSDQTIWRYDYDPKTGELSDPTTFVDTTGRSGKPDGMTVDAEGYVWSARWNGWHVVRHAPGSGEEVDRVELPARKVSAVTFGGPGYETAYVTTAGGEGDPAVEGEGAGGLYAADLGVSGVPEFRSSVDV